MSEEKEKKPRKPIIIPETRDFKGIWIPEKLYLSRKYSPNEKFVLLEIHSLTKRDSRLCYASNKHFADFSGLKENSIQKMLLKFEKDGYIKRFYEYKENSKEIKRRIIKLTQSFYDDFINESEESESKNDDGECGGEKSIGVVDYSQDCGGKNVGDKYNSLSDTFISDTEEPSASQLNSPKGVAPSVLNPTLSEKEVDVPKEQKPTSQKKSRAKPDQNKWAVTRNHIISTMKKFGYDETREETQNALLVFRYYYKAYKDHKRENHPQLSDKAMINVIRNFVDGFGNARYDTNEDMYMEMIDRHFQTNYRKKTDFNICHFMTEDVRNNLYMQLYR